MTAALDSEREFLRLVDASPLISDVEVVTRLRRHGAGSAATLVAPGWSATFLAGALLAFSTTHQAWWLVPLTVMAPDFLAVGYLSGTRTGARLYKLAHGTPFPATRVGLGWWRAMPIVLALGLCGSRTSAWTVSSATA